MTRTAAAIRSEISSEVRRRDMTRDPAIRAAAVTNITRLNAELRLRIRRFGNN